MIMQGKTPQALSRSGLLAVLVLGVLLLPLSAQAPQKEKSPAGEEKEAIQKKIAELKETLRMLENRQGATTRKEHNVEFVPFARVALEELQDDAPKKSKQAARSQAEVDDARHAVEVLAREEQIRRQELQQTQARHKAALARLAALQGKIDPTSGPLPKLPADPKRVQWRFTEESKADSKSAPAFFKESAPYKNKADTAQWEYKPRFDWKSEPSKAANAPPADKSADLEKKLERLMRELEEIRGELKQRRQ